MKPGVTLLRAIAGVCTSLALTACGGPMTEQEAAAVEAEAAQAVPVENEALASQEAEVGSCANWSGWYWDGSSITCGRVLRCGTYCDEYGNCDVNPAAFQQLYRYRACFDQWGNYTHTEYQYTQGSYLYCGC
jgi:hypothetical protein